MQRESCDIFLSGGGIAGLAAAVALGGLGLKVILAEPDPGGGGTDRRTTAFLRPARDLLADAGLWDALAPFATPLATMRLVDIGGPRPVTRDFHAADIGEEAFGWNLPNSVVRDGLRHRLASLPTVDLRPGVGFASLVTRDAAALVTLTDGSALSARLAIAADGKASPLRQAAGIGVTLRRFGQKAVVFTVTHEVAHENISTEVHREGGPFTLVPLPDREGRFASSVVWMTDGAEALRLAALPDVAFAAEATKRSAHVLGPLTPEGPRQVWPIVAQVADRLTARRTALIAEAAHAVPPIGAQGLNMSLADIACLRDLARARPEGLGDRAMLDAYARARTADTRIRAAGIGLLNRASQAGLPIAQALRAAGLAALHDISPARSAVMRAGLGNR